jgi:hypothetical protein
VLCEQLGPGELVAATRVCATWRRQLAADAVAAWLCVPPSYDTLLSHLEQVAARFKNIHAWTAWLPAGRDWTELEQHLWLLGRWGWV